MLNCEQQSQGTKPTKAYIGPCHELETHPGVELPLPIVDSPIDPKGDKANKQMRQDEGEDKMYAAYMCLTTRRSLSPILLTFIERS